MAVKKASEKPIKAAFLTAQEMSKMFGVTVKTIAEWVKAGMPKKAFNSYDSAACLKWWQDNIESAKESTGKVASARDRYWLAKAESEEIKVAKHKGELAPIAEFEKNEAYRMASIRGSLMALPGRLAMALEMKDRETIRETIKREVFAMLENFRRSRSYLADGIAPVFDDEDEKPTKKPAKRKPAKKKVKK